MHSTSEQDMGISLRFWTPCWFMSIIRPFKSKCSSMVRVTLFSIIYKQFIYFDDPGNRGLSIYSFVFFSVKLKLAPSHMFSWTLLLKECLNLSGLIVSKFDKPLEWNGDDSLLSGYISLRNSNWFSLTFDFDRQWCWTSKLIFTSCALWTCVAMVFSKGFMLFCGNES